MVVNHSEFLELPKALQGLIVKGWKPVAKDLLADLLKAYSKGDIDGVWSLINSVDVSKAVQGFVKPIRAVDKLALVFGATRLPDSDGSKLVDSDDFKFGVSKAQVLLKIALDAASERIVQGLGRLVNADLGESEGVVTVLKADLVKEFTSALAGVVGGADEIALAASLHTSRLASFGYMVESTLVGKTRYIINAMFDSRTCPVCVHLDQKVFQVRVEYLRLMEVFKSKTKEDLKRAAPWPSTTKSGLEKLYAMNSEEIQSAGYGSPPFHGYCRCFVDYIEEPQELRETTLTYPTVPSSLGFSGGVTPSESVESISAIES